VRITYTSHGDCATAAEFREAVRRRAPELEDAPPGEAAREFVAEATEREGGAHGTVVISEPSGATVTRRLEGNDCREVTDALAFIVAELGRAIRIDEEGAPPPAGPAAPPSAPIPSPEPARATPASEATPRTSPSRLRWEAGVGLEAVLAPAPDWMLAPFGYFEGGWANDGVSPLLSLRLSFLYAKSGSIHGTVGDAEIRWAVARAELCGPRFGDGSFSASGCAFFDAGAIEGSGSRATDPKTPVAPWLSPGLAVRGQLLLERTLVVGVQAGAFVPLVRPRFYFSNPEAGAAGDTLHEVPKVGFRAGFSLGVLFP
jgi:hypothetical protein